MTPSFGPLRHRQFRLMWIGLVAVSIGGNAMVFALGWLLVQLAVREGHPELAPFYIGLVGVSRGAPGLVFGLLGGVLADRMDRRRLLVITRLVSAGVAMALAVFVLTDHVNLLAIIGLNAVAAVVDSMDMPIRQSTVAHILPPRDLVVAQGLTNSTWNTAAIIGPLLAGVLIGPIGIGGLMVLNAATSIVSVLALFGLHAMPQGGGAHAGMVRSLGEGFVYVMREPVLRWAVLLSAAASLLTRPMSALLPAVADNTLHVGATELSWLLSASAAGGLAGSIVAMALGSVGHQGRLILAFTIAWGLLDVVFALQRDLLPAILLAALPQLCWAAFASFSQVLILARAPDNLRGRAFSLYGVTLSAFMPLGALLLGTLGTLLGVNVAIAIGGLVFAAGSAAVLVTSGPMRAAEVGRSERVGAVAVEVPTP